MPSTGTAIAPASLCEPTPSATTSWSVGRGVEGDWAASWLAWLARTHLEPRGVTIVAAPSRRLLEVQIAPEDAAGSTLFVRRSPTDHSPPNRRRSRLTVCGRGPDPPRTFLLGLAATSSIQIRALVGAQVIAGLLAGPGSVWRTRRRSVADHRRSGWTVPPDVRRTYGTCCGTCIAGAGSVPVKGGRRGAGDS